MVSPAVWSCVGRMEYAQNLPGVFPDAIRHDAGKSGDRQLSRSEHATRPPEMRVAGKLFDAQCQVLQKCTGARRAVCSKIIGFRFKVAHGNRQPLNLHVFS